MKVQYVIAIHLMRWLTNDFRFKWTAIAAIGIHPTKAGLSQLVNFKNAIWHFRRTVVFWPSIRPKMPFKVMHRKEVTHSNGSYERKSRRWAQLIIWDKVKVPLQGDAPEQSDLWTAWQLFPLDDDQTCHSKDRVGDWVGVAQLYNSVKTKRDQLEL